MPEITFDRNMPAHSAHPDASPTPRPIVWVALIHVCGLLLGLTFSLPLILPVLLILLLTLMASANLWRARRIGGASLESGILLLAALGLVGLVQGNLILHSDTIDRLAQPPWLHEQPVRLSGVVDEHPRPTAAGYEILLDRAQVTPLPATSPTLQLHHRVAVFVGNRAASVFEANPAALPLPGSRIQVRGQFRSAWRPAESPSPFNRLRYDRSRRVGGRIAVWEADALLIEAPARPNPLASILHTIRHSIGRQIDRHFDPAAAPLARALLLGEAGRLAPLQRETFAQAGLSHLLAVSGLHTGLILLFVVVLLRACGLSPRRAALAAIPLLVLYAALTGFRPPVMRAAVMGAFLLYGFALGRLATSLASLAAACFFTLVVDPRSILRLDWQLSYVCVLSIILFAPPVYSLLNTLFQFNENPLDRRAAPNSFTAWAVSRWLLLPTALVIAVQIGLAPLQALTFQRLYPLAILNNFVGIYLTSLAMLLLFGFLLLGWLPGIGWALGSLGTISLDALSDLTSRLAASPAASVGFRPLPYLVLIIYCLILLTGSWIRKQPATDDHPASRLHAQTFLRLAVLLAILFATGLWAQRTRDRLDLYMLDVGQGDAFVLRFPNNRLMVVDAGPGFPRDAGRAVIAPFIESLGRRQIDCFVATHADADHIGGAPALFERFQIDHVVLGPDRSSSRVYETFQARLADEASAVLQAAWQSQLKGFAPATVHLLGPVPGLDNNDASVILLVDYQDVQILLTGDLESPGERRLIEAGLLDDIEVLKIGHHGSAGGTSEALLNVTAPELALLSVGAANRYGHPAPSVLARLNHRAVRTLRTDLHGPIWLTTDGRIIEIYAYAGRE